MSEPLTPDHFIASMRMAGEIYNAPISAEGCVILYRALMKQAPAMTAALFDWGMQQALCSCRFMPRLVDILEACYDRDTTNLPKLPDIDPRYADEYQQRIYYRALETRNRALAFAPVDTSKPKAAARLALEPISSSGYWHALATAGADAEA